MTNQTNQKFVKVAQPNANVNYNLNVNGVDVVEIDIEMPKADFDKLIKNLGVNNYGKTWSINCLARGRHKTFKSLNAVRFYEITRSIDTKTNKLTVTDVKEFKVR